MTGMTPIVAIADREVSNADGTANTNRRAKVHKKTAVDDPLLQVPPASRGNRAGAPLAVPLAKRGGTYGGGQL